MPKDTTQLQGTRGKLRFEQMLKAKGGTEFILQDPGMKKMHLGCYDHWGPNVKSIAM